MDEAATIDGANHFQCFLYIILPQLKPVTVTVIIMMGGGDAYNQASVLAALGNRTALLSRMAEDGSGKLMLDTLRKRGVDTSQVAIDQNAGTSTCIVLIREDGQRSFCTYKGCLRTFGAGDVDFTSTRNAKVVSIGGLFPVQRQRPQ